MICAYCSKPIESVRYRTHRSKHYHNDCYNALIQSVESAQGEMVISSDAELEEYLRNLFRVNELPMSIRTQLRLYIERDKLKPTIIRKVLEYFYDIKGNNPDYERPSIGIVPYVYDEAREFYRRLYAAEQDAKTARITTESRVVRISPPDTSLPISVKIEDL